MPEGETAGRHERPPTVYVGAKVLPMVANAPAAEALAVAGGRILGVGSRADVTALAGPAARRVELDGTTILPGLVDTHPHLLHFGAFSQPLVDLSDATCHDDIVARIRARARTTPAGEWIMTTPVGEPHYFLRRSWRDLAEGELPDRHVLDRATDAHPVFLQAWAPVIPNVCAFNSAGLAAVDIDEVTPDRVDHVWIDKDAHGKPTGILRGSVNNYYTNDSFMNDLLRPLPLLDPACVFDGTRRAMREYHRLGVTTVYEGHAMGPGEIEAYRMLRAQGDLRVRVLTALEAEPYGLPWNEPLSNEQFLANLELALSMTSTDDELFRCNGVTLSRGGPCWPGFLRMHEPYKGPYGEPTTGHTFVSEDKERVALEFCASRGLRLNFIGAGYRDHDEFLANAEATAERHPALRRARWILQHAYLMPESAARRYEALGFGVTTSMSFSWGKGDLLAERIGEHVWADLIPLQRLLDAGLTVGCGSDWGPKNVFEHMELAQTHRFCGSGRSNAGPAQAVGRDDAIAMWTREAARVLGWEGVGTLAAGAHADFIVLDRDPSTCALEELAATRVLQTLLGGDIVYDSTSA